MNTREKVAVMQAYLDGKTIELKQKRDVVWFQWPGENEPSWDWDEFHYRITPVVHEVWTNIYNKHGGYKTKEEADRGAARGRIACVKLTFTEGEGL